jgi:hypothetical protein
MKRRSFIQTLIAGLAAGPAIASHQSAAPVVVAPAPTVVAAAVPPVDIRAILTQNMIREIHVEEDRAILAVMERQVRTFEHSTF